MKHAYLLIALSAVSLFACGKSGDTPPPAAEAPAAEVALTEAVPAAAESAPTPQPESTPVPAPAAQVEPVAEAAPAPAAKSPPATPPASPAVAEAPSPDLAHGQQIYRQACAFCHDKGVAGAPKTGDTGAWAPRLAQGMEALYASALRGKGAMPAKGGNPSLADADVKAAVDYLAAQAR